MDKCIIPSPAYSCSFVLIRGLAVHASQKTDSAHIGIVKKLIRVRSSLRASWPLPHLAD
jgi:hypothetical protein